MKLIVIYYFVYSLLFRNNGFNFLYFTRNNPFFTEYQSFSILYNLTRNFEPFSSVSYFIRIATNYKEKVLCICALWYGFQNPVTNAVAVKFYKKIFVTNSVLQLIKSAYDVRNLLYILYDIYQTLSLRHRSSYSENVSRTFSICL